MSSIYSSVAFSKPIKTWFLHPWECLSRNSSTKIPDLATSCCLIMGTLWTNALFDNGGFALRTAMNESCSYPCKLTVHYTVHSQQFPSIWIYFHATACYLSFLLVPVLQMIFKCASSVIILVAALAALQCTNWCLHSRWVPMSAGYDFAPVNQLDFNQLSPGWSGFVSMICQCGVGEED